MNDDKQIIELLTEIRDAQREHLSEHKSYLIEARQFNSEATDDRLKASRENQRFKEDYQLSIHLQRQQTQSARWQAIFIGVGIVVLLTWLILGT